ncbi:MAG: DUF4287 domain-containing protein [Acidobacteriota bacterium]|nr:DUF4287 domain-containing protein [Acidobacteriota bacterium]
MADEKVSGPASYFPSIEAKYGRTIPEWKQVIRESPGYGPHAKHMELVGMLKEKFGMGHGHANALVAHTLGEDREQ